MPNEAPHSKPRHPGSREPAGQRAAAPRDPAGRVGWFDPGWMMLITGLALIAAALILPAQAELHRAEIDRDVALALHEWRKTHLENHRTFADRLESPDEPLLISLVATQLNMIPASSEAVPSGMDPQAVAESASPFPQLLPVYQPPVVVEPFETILMKWTASPRGRLLVLALGILLVFLGVLPPARNR